MKQQYNTALYLRLSRDDELKGESGSISTQRTMLTQYCKEQKMRIVGEYVDDGWSGTNFDRPSFQRMIDDNGRKIRYILKYVKPGRFVPTADWKFFETPVNFV